MSTGRTLAHEGDLTFLPRDTIILTVQGGFWQKFGRDLWFEPGNPSKARGRDLTFPAEVIYSPEEAHRGS